MLNNMVLWADVPVRIRRKMSYCRKFCGKRYFGFIDTYGELPVVNFNKITNKFEPVVNNRGIAYAARNRQMYRKKKESLDKFY